MRTRRRTPATVVFLLIATGVSILLSPVLPALAEQAAAGVEVIGKLPKAQGPVVVTTLGQSPGALMVKMLCGLVKLPCDEKAMLTAEELQAAQKKKETAYKTLFITMGTSLKGMGAAGIDVDQEAKRINALIVAARKAGLKVVGTQLEGPSRRTDETDEKSIRTVAPQSDLLIIRRDVNWDGYFTKTAKDKGIPIILVTQAMDVKEVFKLLFQ